MSRVEDAPLPVSIRRWWYADTIAGFLRSSDEQVVGALSLGSTFDVTEEQIRAWKTQISVLRQALAGYSGKVYFEYTVPRLGGRIDVLALIDGVLFVVGFYPVSTDCLIKA